MKADILSFKKHFKCACHPIIFQKTWKPLQLAPCLKLLKSKSLERNYSLGDSSSISALIFSSCKELIHLDWSSIYLFLPHGRQARWGPWGHGRGAHLSCHLAHAAGCHVVSHRNVVEVHAIAVVHVAVILLGKLWRCLLLWEHTVERGGEGRKKAILHSTVGTEEMLLSQESTSYNRSFNLPSQL